jgi:hypothetical protein
MVVGPDSRIQTRKVTLGIQMPDLVEIVQGLSGGEQVVISDRSSLKAGQPVKPKELQVLSYDGAAQS